MISKNSKIYIAGHKGLVGSAVVRRLKAKGFKNIITANKKKLDLKDQKKTFSFLKRNKPNYIIICAAKVGGILANNVFRAEFIYDNLQIQNNLIDGAFNAGINKFIFLGSSCIYPKFSPQPLKEEYLLTDSLEPTNQWYAIAKITGVKACESICKQFGKDYVSLMPTNLYGINDNYDLNNSPVLPALIRKIHEAKIQNMRNVTIWGTGRPKREFLLSDDLDDSLIF